MKSVDHVAGAKNADGSETEYLKHRQLQSGATGWILLAGLGVAYVIRATSPDGISGSPREDGAACSLLSC